MVWPPVPLNDDKGLARYVFDGIAEEFNIAVERHDAFTRPDGLREVAKAIYEALARRRISYALEPFTIGPGQVIRPPDTILSGSCEGTCLDLALLFAGIALCKELVPILVMLEGHALVAVSLVDRSAASESPRRNREGDWLADGVLRDGNVLRNLVDDGRYVAIECTGFATARTFPSETPEGANRVDGQLSFEAAVQAGRAQLDSRQFRFAIDIAVLRDHHGYQSHSRDVPEWMLRYRAHSIDALMQAGSPLIVVSLADLINDHRTTTTGGPSTRRRRVLRRLGDRSLRRPRCQTIDDPVTSAVRWSSGRIAARVGAADEK